jgi:hypothetical protein
MLTLGIGARTVDFPMLQTPLPRQRRSTRLLRSQLYGVQPNDPITFLIATLLLLAPVFAASLRPALKAASVDPMEALRTE